MAAIFDFISKYFAMVTIFDVIDILLVAYAIYKLLSLVREGRAWTIIRGIALLLILMPISSFLKLNSISFILRNTMQVGVIALIIIFQPELRRALDRVGKSNLNNILRGFLPGPDIAEQGIDEIIEATMAMAQTNTGALIVIEDDININDVIRTGVMLNSDITRELICNIFYPNTPLHDGAMVISSNKIVAAGCLLPLSDREGISKELGTRHRAALGMSEISDAAIIVVSEETGKISFAGNGVLIRNLSRESLTRALHRAFMDSPDEKKPTFFEKMRETFSKKAGGGAK